MRIHSREYVSHLKSEKWAEFKKTAIVNAGRCCQNCGAKNKVLQVHHLHYETLGHEKISDVKVLCVACHELFDKSRENEVENDKYHRSVDTFSRKKFGDDWQLTVGSLDSAYQAFDDWSEKRRDW